MESEFQETVSKDFPTLGEKITTFETGASQFLVVWIVGLCGTVLGVGLFVLACLFQVLLGGRATQGDMALGLLGGLTTPALAAPTLRESARSAFKRGGPSDDWAERGYDW